MNPCPRPDQELEVWRDEGTSLLWCRSETWERRGALVCLSNADRVTLTGEGCAGKDCLTVSAEFGTVRDQLWHGPRPDCHELLARIRAALRAAA